MAFLTAPPVRLARVVRATVSAAAAPLDVGGPCPIARFVTITEYELVYRHPFTRPRRSRKAEAGEKEGGLRAPLRDCGRAPRPPPPPPPPTRACSGERARRKSGSTRPTKNHRDVRPVAGRCGADARRRRPLRRLVS